MFGFSGMIGAVGPFESSSFVIMIDPAGDAQETGRLIDGMYERSLTLAYAQQLKEELESTFSHVVVVLTRASGEFLEPFQVAQFANRCQVNLFLRLQFFHDRTRQSHALRIYHFSWGNELPLLMQDIMFVSIEQAHLVQEKLTKSYAQRLSCSLNSFANSLCKGVFAVPCKPLYGITCPAICIEIGLVTKDNWREYVHPLVHALGALKRS